MHRLALRALERAVGQRVQTVPWNGALPRRPHAPPYASSSDKETPPSIPNRADILELAFIFAASNWIRGAYLEFGCHTGRTFHMAWEASRDVYPRSARDWLPHLWALDSFSGLPALTGSDTEHPRWSEGDFRMGQQEFRQALQAAGVPAADYTTVPGLYRETLTPALAEQIGKAAVVYIDCDLYESTRDVLEWLPACLQQGTIVCMDDWNSFSASNKHGERLALSEADLMLEPWWPYGWHGQSFIAHIA